MEIRAKTRGGPPTRELHQKSVFHDNFRNKQTEKKGGTRTRQETKNKRFQFRFSQCWLVINRA